MYSILPALVSVLFLAYGVYVLVSRGVNRISLTFFLICATTFCWQFTWAILFQVQEPQLAATLGRIGYLLILFLPCTIYHFVVELVRRPQERRLLLLSYAVALALGVVSLTGQGMVAGMYHYFYGYYPRAGHWHHLHVIQTGCVVGRALFLLYQAQRTAVSTERLRLRYCLASLLIYFLAAIDYACNYGVAIYPPGVLFVAISLGIIAQAMARHDLLANPMLLAASIAHEMRTPLATIRGQARVLAKRLPELIAGYEQALAQGGRDASIRPEHLDYLRELAQHIELEVRRSNFIADMVLASARADALSRQGFGEHSVKQCVEQALACYPFDGAAREKVAIGVGRDFRFYGSDTLLVFVLYNLIKNALAAIAAAGRGEIEIAFYSGQEGNHLVVTDTGHGIPEHVLPHVFDPYFTTRDGAGGTGMGLAFCRRVISAFGGTIRCRSRLGHYTTIAVQLPSAL